FTYRSAICEWIAWSSPGGSRTPSPPAVDHDAQRRAITPVLHEHPHVLDLRPQPLVASSFCHRPPQPAKSSGVRVRRGLPSAHTLGVQPVELMRKIRLR